MNIAKNTMSLMMMTPGKWADVTANPAQRDTVKHAAKAVKGHLSCSVVTQSLVQAANVAGIGLVKLDGHTRSYLWKNNELAAPDLVGVVIYEVGSMADAISLYKTIDQSGATEDAKDKLSGAFSLCGIYPKSGAITQSGLTSALALIAGKQIDIYEYSKIFKAEIIDIDGENFGKGKFVAGLLAAVIVGYIRRGPVALEFFRKYNGDQGVKNGNVCDNVEALASFIKEARLKRQIGGAGNHAAIAAVALNGLERYIAGMDKVRGPLKPLDLRAYINEAMAHKATQ